MRLAGRIVVLVAFLALLAVAVVWLVIASPFFADMRRATVASFLGEQIGQPVRIDGDAAVRFDRGIRFHVTDVSVPSIGIPEMALADLERLEFSIAVHSWRPLDIWIDDLWVRGLSVNMLRDGTGRESWEYTEPSGPTAENASGIVDFLRGVTFRFEDVVIRSEDRQSGFDFDFDLVGLDLVQQENRSVATLDGGGMINGETFRVDGSFLRKGPFTSRFDFGRLVVLYDGTTDPAVVPTGHKAQLSVETGDLGNLLDVLRLERVLEGEASLSSEVTYRSGTWSFEDADVEVHLLDGALLKASGDIGDLAALSDVDLQVSGRLHPDGAPPRQSTFLEELVVTDFSGHLREEAGGLTLQDFHVRTNAALRDLGSLGPVSVGRLHRSGERVALEGLDLRAGSDEAPFLHVEGDLDDLLQFRDLHFKGRADLPAEILLGGAVPAPEKFGRLLAEFELNDDAGHLNLSKLNASVEESSLWSLKQSARIGEISEIADVEYELHLEFPDADAVLKEFGIAGFGARPLGIDIVLMGSVADFSTALKLRSGRSVVEGNWRTRLDADTPSLAGKWVSHRLDLKDITYAISVLGALEDIDLPETSEASQQRELQPLVLDKGIDRSDLQPLVLPGTEPREDTSLQPLVLPKDTPSRDDPTLQPLVLEQSQPGLDTLDILLDLDQLRRTAEAQFSVSVKRIVGLEFISALNSNLTLNRGKARLGPVNIRHGPGRASVTVSTDLVRTPQFVSLSGRTDGWDIGQLTELAGVPASGRIHGKFDLVGRKSSADAFLKSLAGNARLTVTNGAIGTSLIELSGLGVLPWLFSSELVAGQSRIGCIVAPLELRNGRVSSNALVLETDTVQVVARGSVDLRRELISVRADARPIGRPLSASAWPVTLSGSLRKPTVELARSRVQRRADDARSMPASRVPCKPDILQLR